MLFRVQRRPQHVVFRADDAGHVLVGLADAAVDGEIGPNRFHGLDPGWRISLEAVAHACKLVVTGAEKAALVPGIVEFEGHLFFDGIGIETDEFGHGIIEFLAQDGLEAGANNDLILGLFDRLKGLDVRIEVGDSDLPIEIVIIVRAGIWR